MFNGGFHRSAHVFCLLLDRADRAHSRPQRPRSFWSAPRIATSGPVQRHSGFEWLCKHNGLRAEPIRFVILDSGHAQSDGKSVNRPIQILLGNFSATFRILSNFFVREQLLATFWKTSTFLVTFRLFNLF